MYLDRDGKVQTVHFRMPEPKSAKGNRSSGDDALHEALGRAPIEDDTLMAWLVLAFAGQNVRVDSANGGGDDYYYGKRQPSAAARTLLRVMDREPEAVLRALSSNDAAVANNKEAAH